MSNKNLILIILGASLLTHFAFFGHPAQTVFDEVHFGKFISGYYTHEYFFDIHPPLGKLMIAGFGKLFDFRPEFSFAQIGEGFPDNKYLALRFLPALAGSLLPLILFLLALELGLSRRIAIATAFLVIFENATLVQSRFILLDAFLLLFGFSALLSYMIFRRTSSHKYLVLAGILGGLSFSIKWTGIAFLGLVGIIEFIHFIKNRHIARFARSVEWLAVVPLLIYFSIFSVHFSLLSKSGPGDAFMTPEFRKTLQGSQDSENTEIEPLNLFNKFTELNIQMYESNQRLNATHSYSSPWYTWPVMTRSIYYWVDSSDAAGNSRIYFLGNPVVWLASSVAVLVLLLLTISKLGRLDSTGWILLGGYFLNLLPFVGVRRVMFLYHYMPALMFAILILGYCLEHFKKDSARWAIGLCVVALLAFLFFAPLTYGLQLTPGEYDLRNWLKSWI